MATTSLFGPTPAELILAQQKEAQQEQLLRNQMIAQQGAEFGPFRGLYQAGLKFGDIAGQAIAQGAFPQQIDPRLQEATAVQSVLSKFADQDQSDPLVLTQIGRQLMSVAPNAGLKALTLAKQLKGESPIAKVDPSKFSPESLKKFVDSGGKDYSVLDSLEGGAKPDKEWTAAARELGLEAKNSFNDYEPGQVASVNAKVMEKRIAEAQAKGMKVNIDLGAAMREVSAQTEGREKQQAWAKAGDTYRLTVPLLIELESANKAAQNAFFGFGAGGKVGLSKALNSIGIPISDRASDTEFLDAISSKLVQRIAKNFPGSQAIKELEQLIKSKPNIDQQANTFMRLLNNVTLEFKADTLAYEKLSKMPQAERYQQDFNIVSAQIYRNLNRYQTLENKIKNKTANLDEANEALSLQRELGL